MPKVTRRRAITSCKYCYLHKVKCDHEEPCKNCIRLNNSLCIYNFQKTELHSETPIQSSKPNSSFKRATYQSNALFPYLGSIMKDVITSSQDENETDNIGLFNFLNPPKLDEKIDLFDLLPSGTKIISAFDVFWKTIHPLLPILDEEIVISNLDNFIDKLSSKKEILDGYLPFMILTFSILFATTIQQELIVLESRKLRKLQEEKTRYYTGFQRIIELLKFPQIPTLECVQASVLIYETGSFNLNGTSTKTCVLNKALCALGVHLNLNATEENNKNIIQKNQILWHTVQKMDTYSSLWYGSLPNLNFHDQIVLFPTPYEYDTYRRCFTDSLDPFIIFLNSIFRILPFFGDLIIYLNVDTSSAYYSKFDLDLFERNLLELFNESHNMRILLEKTDPQKFSSSVNRWLLANSRNFLFRIYFLLMTCKDDKRVRSRNTVKISDREETEKIKRNLYLAKEDLLKKLLKMSKTYSEPFVEIVILLLYETKIRLTVKDDISNFTWSIKNCIPFQYLTILMRDIYNQPNKRYNFKELPDEIQLMIDSAIHSVEGDIREWLVDEILELLSTFKLYWPKSLEDIYSFTIKLQKYLKSSKEDKVSQNHFFNFLENSSLENQDIFTTSNIFDYFPLELDYYNYMDNFPEI